MDQVFTEKICRPSQQLWNNSRYAMEAIASQQATITQLATQPQRPIQIKYNTCGVGWLSMTLQTWTSASCQRWVTWTILVWRYNRFSSEDICTDICKNSQSIRASSAASETLLLGLGQGTRIVLLLCFSPLCAPCYYILPVCIADGSACRLDMCW